MTKRWKITAALAVVMMIALASNVTAQTVLEATSGQSNTNAATAGLFYEDRDFYLSTTDIGSLTKNLIFVNLFAPKILGGKTSDTATVTSTTTENAGGTSVPWIDTDADGIVDSPDTAPGSITGTTTTTTTDTTTSTTTPAKINGFTYDPYFDAGAGLFVGSYWIGFAISYGVVENKSESENAQKVVNLNNDGTEASSATTQNATAISDWTVSDGFKLAAIFGNKTWGIKNSLEVANNRSEGYFDNAAVSAGLTASSLGTYTALVSATPAGSTVTNQPGGFVTKEEYTRGITNNSSFGDTISFGINLGNVIAAAESISPWVIADLKLGYDNDASLSGYGWEYESRDDLTGVDASISYAYDNARAFFDLGIGLSGGVTLKINDIFSFSPELGYNIGFPIYGNKYTDIGGGEATAKGRATTQVASAVDRQGYHVAPNLADSGPIIQRQDTWIANVTEISAVNQTLGLGLKLAAEFPRLSFAIKYAPGFEFKNRNEVTKNSSRLVTRYEAGTNKAASWTQTITTVYDDDTRQENQVVWTNTINIGAQVWLKEDKFRLNLGSSFVNKVGDWTTVKTETNDRNVVTTTANYDDGHENSATIPTTTVNGGTSNSTQDWTQVAEAFQPNYTLGFTFFLNENINFDFLLRSQEDKGENWLELLLPAAWALQFNIRY